MTEQKEMTLNERAQTYHKEKWWPKGLMRADYGGYLSTGKLVWWYMGCVLPDEVAHALIFYGAMVTMADQGHIPALSGVEGEYFVITEGIPREDGLVSTALAAVFNAIDATKEADNDQPKGNDDGQ